MAGTEPVAFRGMEAGDVVEVADLARAIWNRHYPSIITQAQIDYMLAQRYDPARLLAELAMPEICWELARVDGRIAGFSSTIDLAVAGSGARTANELKLDKLYVDVALHGRGIGGALIERAAGRAASLGREALILAVNKRNEKAIAAYRRYGFTVRDSLRADIGQGFVMDDFIMQRTLKAPS